ncbi:unnamed protein product [Durusdinium trenchii]|uniref:Ion transport domain-containing protein n=1 Tax=Durusdinium trenchii TaxID=1381693 RepID=A0ABP0I626_9DINO
MPAPDLRPQLQSLLQTVEEEQRHLLDLLSVQHDQFTLALRESMERMKEVERKALVAEAPQLADDFVENRVVFAEYDEQEEYRKKMSHHDHSTSTLGKIPSPHHDSSRTLRHQRTAQEILGLQNFVDKSRAYVDMVAGTLVCLNCLVMLTELELEGQAAGVRLGLGPGPNLEEVQNIFQTLDTIFVVVFTVELLFRAVLERKGFISDLANAFDTILVILGWLALTISGFAVSDILLLRTVRVLKALRAVRLLRSFRFFKGLRFLVKACYCFIPSLLWAMLLLVVFICMGALVQGSLLQDFILKEDADKEERLWVWNRYGTAYRSLYTMYEITFAGNWPTNARPILETVGHPFVLFYLVYITFVVFATLRVVTAVFLRDTLDAARNDDEALVMERLRNRDNYLDKLESAFEAMTGHSEGQISEEKLEAVLQNPKAQAYFQTLELDIVESHALFKMLDNGDGVITHGEFVDGMLRCKGPARAMEQVAMRAELRQMDHKLSNLINSLQEHVGQLVFLIQ